MTDHNHKSYLQEGGFFSWFTTLDHKKIGLMYFFTIMSFFLLGGIFSLLVRYELWTPEATFPKDLYNKFFTFHGAIMVFMFIIPSIPAALGNFFVPLMIGAKDVAFPRLNLASYYIF
ncbi:MAG: cbb3-type cytochrome c oxidase subunit I, partial [Deltaproteobacteria bacterium]|nr:cbb3-type cytochrome c oxidase subunit I [Deltaproteobacteria bacterium]